MKARDLKKIPGNLKKFSKEKPASTVGTIISVLMLANEFIVGTGGALGMSNTAIQIVGGVIFGAISILNVFNKKKRNK